MGTAIYPLFDSSGNAIAPPGIDVSGGASAAGGSGSTPSDGSSNDSSGWLSGLGDLFQGIGTAVSSGLRASNIPSVPSASGWVYNPATQQYYNPATGQALTSTGALPSAGIFTGSNSNIVVILLIGLAALFLLRRGRRSEE